MRSRRTNAFALVFVAVLAAIGSAGGASGFPGSNGKIAFVRGNFSTGQIVLMEPDGSGQTIVAPGAFPRWSADGRELVFVRAADIWTMNADGSNQRQLTESGDAYDPSWSPDGQRIVFSRSSGENNPGDIFVMNRDGSGASQLTSGPADDDEPSWSPDGTQIAFERWMSAEGNAGDIHVMTPNGEGVTNITNAPGDDHEPHWSPDSSRIVFSSQRAQGFGKPDVYVMKRDGADVSRLTQSGKAGGPTWSPDGTKIAFFELLSGSNFDIFVMDVDGAGAVNVTNSPEIELQADWGPVASGEPPGGTDQVRLGSWSLTNSAFRVAGEEATRARPGKRRRPAGTTIRYRSSNGPARVEFLVQRRIRRGRFQYAGSIYSNDVPDGRHRRYFSGRVYTEEFPERTRPLARGRYRMTIQANHETRGGEYARLLPRWRSFRIVRR